MKGTRRMRVVASITVIALMIFGLGAMAVMAAPSGSGSPQKYKATPTPTTAPPRGFATSTSISMSNNTTALICKSKGAKRLAGELILIVVRLSKVTSRLINRSSVQLTNETLAYYNIGEKYKTVAIEAYKNGSYCTSIVDSFRAMRYYKAALISMKVPSKPLIYYRAEGELRMVKAYSVHVKRLIRWLALNGVNVTNLTNLYNETVKAYIKVREDLKDKNMTALRSDLAAANEKRAQLDRALIRAMGEVLKYKAKLIVERFLKWTKAEIQVLSYMANESNITQVKIWAGVLANVLRHIYMRVDMLAKSGQYILALSFIKLRTEPIMHSLMLYLWVHKHRGRLEQWIHVRRGPHGTIVT